MTLDFNPFAPEFSADPYPHYAALRREDPVHRTQFGFWAVSRYDDVIRVLKDPATFSSSLGPIGGTSSGMAFGGAATVVFSDPPVHTRLRALVSRAFTPRIVAAMEPRIRAITDELMAAIVRAPEFDLVHDLSAPLPVTVIAEMLGVETERRDDFKRWSNTFVMTFASQDAQGSAGNVAEFREYFRRVIDERRARPREDLISALVAAEEHDEALTPDEVLAFAMLLLIAGNETTTNLIGNAMRALTDHPAEMARVVADPSLIPSLVEEALRYDAPVQSLFRRATRDCELAGKHIAVNEMLMVIFASANRDSDRFPEADTFDVARNASGHVAFGHGIHFCLGAPLARLEAQIAIEALLTRLHGLTRVSAQVALVPSFLLRGPATMPMRHAGAVVTAAR